MKVLFASEVEEDLYELIEALIEKEYLRMKDYSKVLSLHK